MNADNALTKAQFELLSAFERAERLNLKPPKGDARELTALGYLENGAITEAGGRALEPYRVRRAGWFRRARACRRPEGPAAVQSADPDPPA